MFSLGYSLKPCHYFISTWTILCLKQSEAFIWHSSHTDCRVEVPPGECNMSSQVGSSSGVKEHESSPSNNGLHKCLQCRIPKQVLMYVIPTVAGPKEFCSEPCLINYKTGKVQWIRLSKSCKTDYCNSYAGLVWHFFTNFSATPTDLPDSSVHSVLFWPACPFKELFRKKKS